VRYGREEVDLSACRTHASLDTRNGERVLTLEPVTIELNGLTIQVQTIYRFPADSGEIWISRRIVGSSDPAARITVDEYITSCYGTTEYPEDLSGVKLSVQGPDGTIQTMDYAYQCREYSRENAAKVSGLVPQVNSLMSMTPGSEAVTGYVREGYAFAPNLTLGMCKTIGLNEELLTCLRVAKAR
jgi:hypothetical protein